MIDGKICKANATNINICLILLGGITGTVTWCAGIFMQLNYLKIKYESGKLNMQAIQQTHRFM